MAVTNAKSTVPVAASPVPVSASTTSAVSMVMALYFIRGSITSLNGIVILHLKSIFHLELCRSHASSVNTPYLFIAGILIAVIGGAIIPLAQGVLADQIGLYHSFLLVAVVYVYIAWYGFQGYRPSEAS